MPPPPKRRRLPFKPPRSVAAVTEQAPTTTSKPVPTSNVSHKPVRSTSRQRSKTQINLVSRTPSPAPTPEQPSRSRSAPPSELHDHSPSRSLDSLSSDPDYILAEIIPPKEDKKQSLETSEPDFPPKLLAAIIHGHMKNKGEKMRITKDANKLYAKYIDLFVKEAVARAIYERREQVKTDGMGGNRIETRLDSYLEVEDLEKLAPQLLLDF
ncbi:hypothetical protein PRK78_000055 [Emydomyces testavorans]|uniref:Uncharacterized protein n=1 Tax=Emydomyces testavorans TaxID=2070801 RepID=A0AAF0DAK1_9EURO|nr:hypothetical protein PRK78_000055 [Emydomyces testavorans]